MKAALLLLAGSLISAGPAHSAPRGVSVPPEDAPGSTPTPFATPTPAPLRGLVNRSILTVERRTYSLFDVELLLLFWNIAAPEAKVDVSTDWNMAGGFFIDHKKSFLRNYEKWPADVRRLLFITLSWPELSRLVAFSSSEDARAALLQKAREMPSAPGLGEATRRYLADAPREPALELVDMVLRARLAEQNRGGIRESNASLLWFWHQRIGDEAKKP